MGARLADCPALVDLLRNEQATGSEIVLHGWTHRAAGPARGPWHRRLRARLFAGTAAEFLTLEPDEMRRRLAAGQEMLRALGLEPAGFCAPAWLPSPALRPLLQERGFRYQVGMGTLDDLVSDRRWTMPWLGYMGAGAIQEVLIAMGGRVLLAAAPAAPAVKVFMHPQGAPASAACADILQRLERLLCQRTVITYGQFLFTPRCFTVGARYSSRRAASTNGFAWPRIASFSSGWRGPRYRWGGSAGAGLPPRPVACMPCRSVLGFCSPSRAGRSPTSESVGGGPIEARYSRLSPRSLIPWLAWAVLRLGTAGRGRAIGVLSVWLVWERLTVWRWHLQPIREGGVLRFMPRRHAGAPVVLRDGTIVKPGESILELHLDNRALAARALSDAWTPWQVFRLIADDLTELACQLATPPFVDVVAIHGVTLLAPPGTRLGFEFHPLPRTLGWAFVHYFLVGLLAVYHPRGWQGAARVRERAWPGELWMSRDTLLARFATRRDDPE